MKVPTCSEEQMDDGIQRAERREMGKEVDQEKVVAVSKELEKENVQEMKREKLKSLKQKDLKIWERKPVRSPKERYRRKKYPQSSSGLRHRGAGEPTRSRNVEACHEELLSHPKRFVQRSSRQVRA